jgi:DNA-binding transcriptional regulator YiaG
MGHTPGWKRRQAHRPGEIKLIRKALSMTQEQFAAEIGVDHNTVSRWELGSLRVGQPAIRLARLLAKGKEALR